ncbi:MAG: translation initiation factor [Opitutales bacterium]
MTKRVATDGGDGLANNVFANIGLEPLPEGRPGQTVSTDAAGKRTAASKGRVDLRREKSGRGGKTVTCLSAFSTHLPLSELERLAFDLKKRCACGGTLKGRMIELQGDVRDRVLPELEKRGYKPVLAGG